MRKLISCAFALVLISMFSPCALSEEIDILGEWGIYPFIEEQRMTVTESEEGIIEYRDGSMVEYNKSENGIIVSFPGDEKEYHFDLFANNSNYTLLTFGEDISIVILSTSFPEGTNNNTYKFYEIGKESTALFTTSRMISDGKDVEYFLNRGVLYILDENGYEKGDIEIISDNAFIWHIESDTEIENSVSYNYAVLMIR